LRPRMPKVVASVADTVEHIVRGTMYGPILRTPLLRSRSPVSICQRGEPPPEPAIAPMRGLRTCSASSPASAIAERIDTYAYAAASPMKRFSLRSITASRSMFGTPATWLRMPSSAYSGIARMPLRLSRSARDTVAGWLPRHDTMPMPVTTTRRISKALGGLEQAHAHVAGLVDQAVVDEGLAVGDHQPQLAAHHATDVDLVAHQLGGGHHLAGELHVAHAQRAAAAGLAQPRQVETAELPHGIQAQAAGHHRVADEVATEKPKVRMDVHFGADAALAVAAALFGNVRDAIEHQHRRRRQPRVVVAEQFAAPAGAQLLVVERGRTCHEMLGGGGMPSVPVGRRPVLTCDACDGRTPAHREAFATTSAGIRTGSRDLHASVRRASVDAGASRAAAPWPGVPASRSRPAPRRSA